MFEQILFYLFSSTLVLASLAVISVRNPVHAALFLVLAFFNAAALWVLLEAEFLAATLVIVYVGAVMVLFLFVVMMLDINIARMREGFARHLPIGAAVALVLVGEILVVVGSNYFSAENYPWRALGGDGFSNTVFLADALFTRHLFAFEVAAVILLVAIIAAIMLTLRKRTGTRTQVPGQQVRIRREDRIRMVRMDGERP